MPLRRGDAGDAIIHSVRERFSPGLPGVSFAAVVDVLLARTLAGFDVRSYSKLFFEPVGELFSVKLAV